MTRPSIQWMIGVFLWGMGALLMPSAVFAVDGAPTVFYAYMIKGEQADLVQIDVQTGTLTNTVSIPVYWDGTLLSPTPEVLPQNAETFLPAEEWQAFQDDLATLSDEVREAALTQMTTEGIDATLHSVWEAAPGKLLLHRTLEKCHSGEGYQDCYGATQLSVFDIAASQERVIWTLPFHRARDPYNVACYSNDLFENYSAHDPLDQVLIHPTRDVVAVVFNTFDRQNCPNMLFVIDYSQAEIQVAEFANFISVAWSPDGRQLGYIENCASYAHLAAAVRPTCTDSYGIIDLASMNITFFKEFAAGNGGWIAWPQSDTLVFSQKGAEPPYQSSIVWYSLTSDVETPRAYPEGEEIFTVLTLRDRDSQIIVGNGKDSVMQFPNQVLNETPSEWTPLEDEIVWPLRLNTAHSDYALFGNFLLNTVTVVDADLNRFPINLDAYRQSYGADGVRLVTVGRRR